MNIYSKEAIYFPIGDLGDKANWRNSTSIISGKTLLYNYIGTIPNNLYVPKIRGTAVINDWYNSSASGTTDSNRNTPFCNNPAIVNVNLQKVPFRNNSMYNAFYNCQNLKHVSGINSNVTNMSYTFYNCYNLNQNIQIPSSVTDMSRTFYKCYKLNQNIQIPSSVTSMYYTFYYCTNLNQNIQIPSSVTNMSRTFYNCYRLKSRITIVSPNVSDTTNCFYNVTSANVVFPMRFINNVNSTTRNSLVTAGYAIGTGVGNSVSNTTQNTQFYAWDGVGGDYSTYTGNNTHWVLSKWSGTMAKWFNGGTAVTNVTVPSKIFGYSTAINYPCFYANTVISNVECSGAPIAGTTMVNAFRGCTNLKGVYSVNIPSGITSLVATFYNDDLLQNVTTNTKTAGIRTVNMDIPNTVTNIQAAFGFCKNVANFYLYNGFGITTIASAFNRCNTRALNVRLEAPNIATVTNAFGAFTTTYRKNIYIYFKYKNGVTTKTFNAFKPVQYMGTSGNTSMANPSYNSSSNFYIYNIGTCPV